MTDWTSIIARTRRVPARNAALRSFQLSHLVKQAHRGSNQCHASLPYPLTIPSLFAILIEKHPPTWQIAISNPIDPPASAAPAAHFKRLYRNCPAGTATPLTPAWGSHDRVLTFYGHFRNRFTNSLPLSSL
jgi:hypothetical protein